LRNSTDFEFERNIASINKELSSNLETVFICTDPAYSHISSTVVRDVLRHGGDATSFLPNALQNETF
jgi:pantetheine-phosphate adenylyltransferase